ncbi:MAG: L,D-transpeptidase family protein [Mycobacteriales bacterium]
MVLVPSARRTLVVAVGTALLVTVQALPGWATTPPAPPTSLTAAVGDHVLDLAWSGGGGTSAIVRDVTGQPTPYTPTSGRAVAPAGPTTAHDTGFTNLGTATYAVWSLDADGTTTSDTPLVQDVPVAPKAPTALTSALSRTVQPAGTAASVSGHLTWAGLAAAHRTLELYATERGTTTARLVRRITTDGNGDARTTLALGRSSVLQLLFRGDAFSAASSSARSQVFVLPRVAASLTPAAIVRFETSVLAGRVSPVVSGAVLYVQRRVGTTWQSVAAVRTTSTGSYRYLLRPQRTGLYGYRVVLPGRISLLGAVSSAVVLRVDARDLSSGLHGDDVLALQRRLAALHYDVGALDGAFGYDLTHAVMTFQKVERLPVTGRWTKVERTRAGRPTAWRVRYPAAGLAAEVDVTRQVLVLSRGGVLLRVVDVSTGSEKVYYQDGVRNVAHTPRGRFRVYRKIDGIHMSPLGELYRPAYWFQGYAVHGSASVPAYAASHGCVRVTDPVMDRLFPILAMGTPVTVYDE